jgi:regulator of sirC expression with transglutaminase-like and TPR domain
VATTKQKGLLMPKYVSVCLVVFAVTLSAHFTQLISCAPCNGVTHSVTKAENWADNSVELFAV